MLHTVTGFDEIPDGKMLTRDEVIAKLDSLTIAAAPNYGALQFSFEAMIEPPESGMPIRVYCYGMIKHHFHSTGSPRDCMHCDRDRDSDVHY